MVGLVDSRREGELVRPNAFKRGGILKRSADRVEHDARGIPPATELVEVRFSSL